MSKRAFAILQHKAEQKGFKLSNHIAFYIAEHIFNNVRQLEGAVNRLGAYCRLMHLEATEGGRRQHSWRNVSIHSTKKSVR